MDEKSLLRKIFIDEQAYKCINDEEDMKMKIKDMILVVIYKKSFFPSNPFSKYWHVQ